MAKERIILEEEKYQAKLKEEIEEKEKKEKEHHEKWLKALADLPLE